MGFTEEAQKLSDTVTSQVQNMIQKIHTLTEKLENFSNKITQLEEVISKIERQEGGEYSELFNTFNPRLNTMTDMLQQILLKTEETHKNEVINEIDDTQEILNKLLEELKRKDKGKQIILSGEKQIIQPMANCQNLLEHLRKLVIRKEQNRPITIADLEKHFGNKKEQFKIEFPQF